MHLQQEIFALKGDVIFTAEPQHFTVCSAGYLVIDKGEVVYLGERLPDSYAGIEVQDYGHSLLLPGFVDLHTHAPQFNQTGLGMDDELLDWLHSYTFPEEGRFQDTAYAQAVYEKFADRLAVCGTTRSALFATIHKESCRVLFRVLQARGLSAYIGKVNMDTNAPEFLCEDTAASLRDTEELLGEWQGNPLLRAIITPRFAPTSTREQLAGLGRLVQRYKIPVQSHLSENRGELSWVAELFPEFDTYYKVYEHYHLFGETPTLMAHCIHLTDAEIRHLAETGVVAVHCPDSNLNLTSGLMPARRMLQAGVHIGLGSDIGAGHTLFMPQVMVRAVQVSKMVEMQHPQQKALQLSEVFYMATKGGGSFFGRVGSFEPGYEADVLVVRTPLLRQRFSVQERLQYFIYGGDTSDILARYIAGRKI